MSYQTVRKTPILSGMTPEISFQIVNERSAGFRPDTLVMSVYDVSYTPAGSSRRTTMPPFGSTPLSQSIVNGRNNVDVLSSCADGTSAYLDEDGNTREIGTVQLHLEEGDTEVAVPDGATPGLAYRRILFRWEWDTDKVGKHEVVLTIAPDRKTVAT